jgi:hypothetical protein
LVCHLAAYSGPEKVVWAASPEWIINDLPNVGMVTAIADCRMPN